MIPLCFKWDFVYLIYDKIQWLRDHLLDINRLQPDIYSIIHLEVMLFRLSYLSEFHDVKIKMSSANDALKSWRWGVVQDTGNALVTEWNLIIIAPNSISITFSRFSKRFVKKYVEKRENKGLEINGKWEKFSSRKIFFLEENYENFPWIFSRGLITR